jgi:hypothetical protein
MTSPKLHCAFERTLIDGHIEVTTAQIPTGINFVDTSQRVEREMEYLAQQIPGVPVSVLKADGGHYPPVKVDTMGRLVFEFQRNRPSLRTAFIPAQVMGEESGLTIATRAYPFFDDARGPICNSQ